MSERKGVQQLTNGGKNLLTKQGQDHKMINFWGGGAGSQVQGAF